MLREAGTSVAMGNAAEGALTLTVTVTVTLTLVLTSPHPSPNPNPNRDEGVRAEAQYVVGTNAEDGWVDAMQRYVLDRL